MRLSHIHGCQCRDELYLWLKLLVLYFQKLRPSRSLVKTGAKGSQQGGKMTCRKSHPNDKQTVLKGRVYVPCCPASGVSTMPVMLPILPRRRLDICGTDNIDLFPVDCGMAVGSVHLIRYFYSSHSTSPPTASITTSSSPVSQHRPDWNAFLNHLWLHWYHRVCSPGRRLSCSCHSRNNRISASLRVRQPVAPLLRAAILTCFSPPAKQVNSAVRFPACTAEL